MRRRDFVQRLPVVGSGFLLGASSLSLTSCGGVAYLVPVAAPGRLVIGTAELGPGAEAFLQGPDMSRPVYMRRAASGEITALLASCTHNGCQPTPLGDRLVCPCHGSEFSFDGAVLQGPAERPLTRYEVTEADGQVTVWLEGRGA
ncbi:MAG: Rieske (2Fe-2S) protein [Gemmatimonadota bacterium]|nr:Rieske (2Fe-2S) protein [Gemmatimonadota bacterium]MDH3422157.1 Rieske (2Fe-2S) protein [Gemmatimonadota bacterium]